MRILYHHRTLGDGAEGIHVKEMVRALRNIGHDVLLVGPAVTNSPSTQPDLGWLSRIKSKIKGALFDGIEVGYNAFGLYCLLTAIARFKPDLIYDRYITFNYSSILAGNWSNIPVFLEFNAPLAYERDHETDESLHLKALAYHIEKKAACDATKTIAVSSPMKNYLVSIGVPERKVIVLPNGVNTNTFYPRPKPVHLMRRYQLSEQSVVIGFVGILRHWHGLDRLLEAFLRLCQSQPSAVLLLVGDGPIRESLLQQALHLGIANRVRITGRIPHEEIANHIALFDIAVSADATFYASPMKIVEYMAMQKPVVAPRMDNICDLLRDGKDSLLFSRESAKSLSDALARLAANPSLRLRLGENALARVRERLNWERSARAITQLLEEIP